MNMRTMFIATAALAALATPAHAQMTTRPRCPTDPLGQQLLEYYHQQGQVSDERFQECQRAQQQQQQADQAQLAQQQAAEQKRRQEENNKDQVVQMAKHLFATNPGLIDQCYEDYKDNLDDPSSFQVSKGDGFVDYGPVGDAYGHLMADYLVWYSKIVRQKNQYGALVAYGITCYYMPKDGTLTFQQVRWAPMHN